MAQKSTSAFKDTHNLHVLQKSDPQIVEVLGTSGHVTLYTFSEEEQQWVSYAVTANEC